MNTKIEPKHLVVDASHTYGSGLNSGVQRVVRNACSLSAKNGYAEGALTVVCKKDRWWLRDISNERDLTACLHRWRTNPVDMMPGLYQTIAQTTCKLLPLPFLRKWLLPESGHLGAFKFPLKAYSKYSSWSEGKTEIDLARADLLLLPDAYWAKEEVWPAVEAAKARGVKIAIVVYDLIPLTHPQFVSVKAVEPFKRYLHNVAKYADMVVAISETVRNQVEELFRSPEYECSNDCVFASFELGAEFEAKEGVVREHVRAIFPPDANNAPHLMVATFDPRKNHSFVLDAFDEIWKQFPDRKLCFIGRVGWLCEDVIERIQQHPKYGKQLFALHDVSDVELHYCYQRARSVLMPSTVEGFGLPIAEALWHQRHVFASATDIHKEVGRDECEYFSLDTPKNLAKMIIAWEMQQDDCSPRKDSHYQPISWEQSVASLIEQCTSQLFPDTAEPDKQAA